MWKWSWCSATEKRLLGLFRVRSMCTQSLDPLSPVRQRLLEHEAARLETLSAEHVQPHPPQPSAVLVALFHNPADDELSVLLTLRSSKLKVHSGEVACPGGRHEECDRGPVDTALREAREEIGLPPHLVEVLTQLPPYPTRNGDLVVPVVGFIPTNFSPACHLSEVEATFRMPLQLLLDDTLHSSHITNFRGMKYPLHSFNYVDNESGRTFRVWGFTAQVCMTVASLAIGQRPSFHANLWHYGKDHTRVGTGAQACKL